MQQEKQSLEEAVKDKFVIQSWVQYSEREFIVEFPGPVDTIYTNKLYKLRIVLPQNYPFTPPECFFIGEAPDHPFYRFDKDDSDRPTRRTNLANHKDYEGLMTPDRWNPCILIPGYVEFIQSSLNETNPALFPPFIILE